VSLKNRKSSKRLVIAEASMTNVRLATFIAILIVIDHIVSFFCRTLIRHLMELAFQVAEYQYSNELYAIDYQQNDDTEADDDKACNTMMFQLFGTNLPDCCRYPRIVFLDSDDMICADKCEGAASNYEYLCCMKVCRFEKLNFLADGDVNPTAVISSFGASVDFNKSWMYIIESAVNRCYDTAPFTDEYSCKVIPSSFEQIIACTFKQLYLQCVDKIDGIGCDLAYKYVDKCM